VKQRSTVTVGDRAVTKYLCTQDGKEAMSYIRKITAMAMTLLFGAGSLFSITAYGEQRPEYLKSVTYFGDEWPINYWNSEDSRMEENLRQIADDGFNSIILAVPWREFQPMGEKQYYNELAFERLEQIMECAESCGLWVVLRVGYTWDYYGAAEIPARYDNVTQKGSEDWYGWLKFAGRLYETASAHPNFHSGFITWEDFWNYIWYMDRDFSMSLRNRLAKQSGFTVYLRERYSLEEVSSWYGESFKSFDEVYLPYGSHPSARLFYEYYDQYLIGFLKETQMVFPGLSMEIRADGDRVYMGEDTFTYYSHSATYSCEGAPYSALMYSVSMGQKNENDRITADTALKAMQNNLRNLYEAGGKRLYVEQLLYMDSTEAYSSNTQIREDQVDTFVRSLTPVLLETTSGYGLWVYRNYVNNCVYNSQFGLGKEGWNFSGSSTVEERKGTKMAVVGSNGGISQNITGRLPESGRLHVDFYAESDQAGADVKIQVGNLSKKVHLTGAGTYTLEFPWQDQYNISITGDKKIYLDDIRVYTYEQNGRIYERNGAEGDLAGSFRALNRTLN